MMATLLYYDGQADINTFAEYPQFLKYDRANSTVVPYTAEDAEAATEYTFLDRFINFFGGFVNRILSLMRVIVDMITGIRKAV